MRTLFSFVLTTLFIFLGAQLVWGHAFVIEESPAPNSILEIPPDEVKIKFNSKVEKDFSIKLIDKNQQEIIPLNSEITMDQKEIKLKLPTLEGGNYLVEYYVVSSNDGHPVQGSFAFKVAQVNPPQQQHTNQETELDTEEMEVTPVENELISKEETIQKSSKINASEMFIYVLRAIYYIGLLVLIGWVIGWRIIQTYPDELKKKYLFWGVILQMLHLVGLISIILVQLNIFTTNGLSFAVEFSFEASLVFGWFVSLLLALAGFVFLFRKFWFDYLWIAVIVVFKSLNGHSMEFEPSYLLVITNRIHLLAASIWAAGLMFIIIFWRKHKLYIKTFLPMFSKYALYSFIILTVTGTFTTIMFLPSVDYLLTKWGIVLLIKVLLIFLVILIAFRIRKKNKNGNIADLEGWLKFDFYLMIVIVVVVSILTYLNPLG